MSVVTLIPAAGMGSRMGAAINKQYLLLQGRPILSHTVELFEESPLVDRIYLISPSPEIDFCRSRIVEPGGFTKIADIVSGGDERQDSVYNGLEACSAKDDDIVVIHDGVRPFLPPALLPKVIDTAARVGGCVVSVPVKDTVKEVEDGRVCGTPQRERLWLAQTPQAFPFGVIREAHRRARSDGFRGTDDSSLVERLGWPVAVVEGSYRNIKITTPEDLVVARALLADTGALQT